MRTTLILIALIAATPVSARMTHAPHSASGGLTEPGQGAFAAMSEVVAKLEADPATDWSRVDIDALRDHLVDMDRLVRDTVVSSEELPNGMRFTVTGDASTLAAAGRMVPAHARELAEAPIWIVTSAVDADAVRLEVRSDNRAEKTRIAALGFFGLMASRDHHREHHLAIATGSSPRDHR